MEIPGFEDLGLGPLRTRTIRPGEDHNDPQWHNDPRMDEVRQHAAQAGLSMTEVGFDVPMFKPEQEHLPEIPDARMKDKLPHDPFGFLRAVGEDLPPPKPISLDDARQERSERVASIFRDHNFLEAILQRHEATIQKRWMKKTKDQKKRILLTAWPGMPALHRPDVDSFRDWQGDMRQIGSHQRSACMWPSINQEDLSKPRSLPLFLNARGRHPPSEFAAADLEAMHIGLTCGAVVPRLLDDYVMLLIGKTTEEQYAELLSKAEYKGGLGHISRHMQPGEALLILECQQKILSFLVACAKGILHDMGDDEASLLNASPQPEPTSVSENETGIASLATLTAERPYRPAAHLSFARIESILAAKRDSCEDHLWQLREDPSYFERLVLEEWEHREELVLGFDNQPHALFQQKPPRTELVWAKVMGNHAAFAYMNLEFWAELTAQARALREAQERHGHIDAESDLPKDYLDALLKFRFYLDKAFEGMGQLEQTWVASPAWRKFFRSSRMPPDDPTAHMFKIGVYTKDPLSRTQQQLLWLGKCLWDQKKTLRLAKPINVIDELQRVIECEPKAKDMFSNMLLDAVSDLSIIAEVARQLDLFQPWASILPHLMKVNSEKLQTQWDAKCRTWGPMVNALIDGGKTLQRYGAPTGKRFTYPVDQRRTRETTEQMQQAEANLDKFWEVADGMLCHKAGKLDGTHLRELLLQPRVIQRTPAWVEPSLITQSKKPAPPSEDTEAIRKPLSEIYFDLERRTERTVSKTSTLAQPKSKQKSRGVAAPPTTTEEDQIDGPNPVDPQPTFHVDNRALKVFKTLFYTPTSGSTPGEVAWTDFLHALGSVGFKAEKLYGSVWQFSPTKLDVERSIQFHEPHPEKKIPFYAARRHGRRLNRAYGWFGGMFVLG